MKTIIGFLFLLSFSLLGKAQQVLSTAAASVNNGEIKIDWTIGEPLSETLHGSNFHLTQGFNQDKLVLTSVDDDFEDLNKDIRIFPNPVYCLLTVCFDHKKYPEAQLLLYDATGKQVVRKMVAQQTETIDMEALPVGTYLLHVLSGDKMVVRTAKVLKK